ncbi:hypothetical protein G7074_18245 [Pedobacter sp. HDW13]|uniref:hypothetical protein n=1 Tax=Pedobacter sp. HDW13 TaxID=2714940 RepID=UPI00140B2A16|nr:hypothetical protein [Pedobacter sp. HDW13]QIL41035.1 hypothetical protein G7074_18245 [Pedobacter sp. HDW13]
MKKLILLVLAIVLIVPSNGCRILREKDKHTSLAKTDVMNNVNVSKQTIDSLVAFKNYIYNRSSQVISEEINYKFPNTDKKDLEITANFRVDPVIDLKGDTAFKLVDVKNDNVSVTVYQNKRTNELMAKVKTENGIKELKASEIQIKRTTTTNSDVVDTSKKDIDVKRSTIDSVDKSKSSTYKKEVDLQVNKEVKSVFLGWWCVFLVIPLLIIIFKRKSILKWIRSKIA